MKITKKELIKLIKEQNEFHDFDEEVMQPEDKAFLMNLQNVLKKCPYLNNQQEKNSLYIFLVDCLFAHIDNSGFDKNIAAKLTAITNRMFYHPTY